MTLTHILVFTAYAGLTGWLVPRRWRINALLAGSLAAIYWLQPSTPIRNLDFWLPTAAVVLTVFVWVATRPTAKQEIQFLLEIEFLALAGVILIIGLAGYLMPAANLTPSRPPGIGWIILVLGLTGALIFISHRWLAGKPFLPTAAILAILALFIVLKTEPLARAASAGLRTAAGQSSALASATDLPWLGFSYLAFRLLHALRDHQSGKLPPCSLSEFAAYALFFPAYTAGPIDRSQRFIAELRGIRQEQPTLASAAIDSASSAQRAHWQRLTAGGQRILMGVFKKFVLADSLALIALNSQNAAQSTSTLWTWVLLYAYTLRIYFDFAGYTDIAIGLGRLAGFHLPENFERPYLKTNLTAFWNSWHITLAQWFRAYFFNPLTRALRTKSLGSGHKLPVWIVILAGQLSTMTLIGLWHGVAWNFAAWGAWHGLGMFIHNRWSDWIRPRLDGLESRPSLQRLLQVTGWLLTFHYVALGWVWFALPDPALAWSVLQKLLGLPA